MGAFTNDYDPTKPLGSQYASQIDNEIRSAKAAIEERMALEHQSFVSGDDSDTTWEGQGRHIPGIVGVLLRDTAANIIANYPTAGEGALAVATDTGNIYRFDRKNGTGWGIEPFVSEIVAGEGITITPSTNAINCDIAEVADVTAGTAEKMIDAEVLQKLLGGGMIVNIDYSTNITSSYATILDEDFTPPVTDREYLVEYLLCISGTVGGLLGDNVSVQGLIDDVEDHVNISRVDVGNVRYDMAGAFTISGPDDTAINLKLKMKIGATTITNVGISGYLKITPGSLV